MMTKDTVEFEEWYSVVIDLVELERPGFIVDHAVARTDYDMGNTTISSAKLFINQREQ